MKTPRTYEQIAEDMRHFVECANEVQAKYQAEGRTDMVERSAVIYEAIAKHCVRLFDEAW